MWKEWIWPTIAVFLKAMSLIGVLVVVWAASGVYHRDTYKVEADQQIHIRVREECLRPDWVKTDLDARQFDVTIRELDVVAEKTAIVNHRLNDLIVKTERVEALRQEMVQSRVPPRMGGMGGPAPSKR